MTDIVERLECNGRNCCLDAAAEIERLRAALDEVLEDYETYEFWTDGNGGYSRPMHNPDILRRARKALEGKDEGRD